MTVPSFFSSEFRFGTSGGHTDVQTILDFIATEILALAAPWTLGATDEYTSPIPSMAQSADQRSMQVFLSRRSATRLGIHTKNAQGITVQDGSIDMAVSPGTVRVFSGPHHLLIEIEDGAGTKESGWQAILDPSPFPIASLGSYVVAGHHRDDVGTLRANIADEAVMIDDQTTLEGRLTFHNCGISGGSSGKTTAGSIMILPVECHVEVDANEFRGAGKVPQMIVVPPDQLAGAVITAPLDESVTGDFFVVAKSLPAVGNAGRLAVRSN